VFKGHYAPPNNINVIEPTTSEELRSQSITILKMSSPITPTKIVESKWWDNMINYTS